VTVENPVAWLERTGTPTATVVVAADRESVTSNALAAEGSAWSRPEARPGCGDPVAGPADIALNRRRADG
jgi:hypothetical protein